MEADCFHDYKFNLDVEFTRELKKAYSNSEIFNTWTLRMLQEKGLSSSMKFWGYNIIQAHIYRQKKKIVGGRQQHMDSYANKKVFIVGDKSSHMRFQNWILLFTFWKVKVILKFYQWLKMLLTNIIPTVEYIYNTSHIGLARPIKGLKPR